MMFDTSLFLETLRSGLNQLEICLPEDALHVMAAFAERIAQTNQTLNLTRLIEAQEMAIKNFADSLTFLLLEWPGELRCLDLGTGAGFPGVPLAIAKPGWKWVLLDSTRKRLSFIANATGELGLGNVATVHARAEDAGRAQEHREAYDLVVSRAVAELPVLLEFGAPFVQVGGMFAAYKGSDAVKELAQSEVAQQELGFRLAQSVPLELPYQMGERNLLLFRKIESVSERYPRKAGIAQKRPLI